LKCDHEDTIINWGGRAVRPEIKHARILNHPDIVNWTSNKRRFFTHMDGRGVTPPFTLDIDEARSWAGGGQTVVCRTCVRAKGGIGIVIAKEPDEVVEAQLYTLFISNCTEYRIHVVAGKVVDVVQKKRKNGQDWNMEVRNKAGGWIYARNGVFAPHSVTATAIRAFDATGLDFGAVDVLCHNVTAAAYVLEINSAPGLEGTTIQTYAKALKELVNED
jgi:glutathione synthase/RimK-type ligase-like ATP-grasp enzyme